MFWFTLPATVTPAAPAEPVPAEDARRAVLIVEDDAPMRDVLVALVEPIARAVPVASAEAALEALAREPVHAVILDPGLPGMDGFTLAQRIRASPDWRRLPVFVFSAFEHSPEALRTAGIRAADVYVKTRDSEAILFERLRHELAVRR